MKNEQWHLIKNLPDVVKEKLPIHIIVASSMNMYD
jgi:hypothetical protein